MPEKLAEWIDTIVIAEEILFHLRAAGLPPTYENATRVWLNFLEAEIHEGLRNSCQGLVDQQEAQAVQIAAARRPGDKVFDGKLCRHIGKNLWKEVDQPNARS